MLFSVPIWNVSLELYRMKVIIRVQYLSYRETLIKTFRRLDQPQKMSRRFVEMKIFLFQKRIELRFTMYPVWQQIFLFVHMDFKICKNI
jgi:hypothetical protein